MKASEQLFFSEEKITNTDVEGTSTTDKIYIVDTSDYNSLVSYSKNETKKIYKFKKMLPSIK